MLADTRDIKQGTIPVGYQLRLVGGDTCTALINRFGVDNSWLGSVTVSSGQVVTLGEFIAEQDFNITVTVGSLDYQLVLNPALSCFGVAGNLTVVPERTTLTLPENTQAAIYNSLTVSGSYVVSGELRVYA